MSIETHDSPTAPGHGDYERRDIGTREIFYFLAGLAGAAILIHLLLAGLYNYLDKRERAQQPPVHPLISNVPADTRKVPPKYPAAAFPDPRLETDERSQLNDIRLAEEQALNGYGWVDQKAGTVRIPIERAMDLLAQRGLPVGPHEVGGHGAHGEIGQKANKTKGNKQ